MARFDFKDLNPCCNCLTIILYKDERRFDINPLIRDLMFRIYLKFSVTPGVSGLSTMTAKVTLPPPPLPDTVPTFTVQFVPAMPLAG